MPSKKERTVVVKLKLPIGFEHLSVIPRPSDNQWKDGFFFETNHLRNTMIRAEPAVDIACSQYPRVK